MPLFLGEHNLFFLIWFLQWVKFQLTKEFLQNQNKNATNEDIEILQFVCHPLN